MASKKHKGTKKKTTKRRLGAISNETQTVLMTVAGAITGAVAKRFIDNAIAKQTAVVIDPKLLNAGQVLIGAGVAWYVKNPFLRGMGVGMAAEAGVSGLVSLGVLSGSDMALALPQTQMLSLPRPRPNMGGGVTATPTIAGANAYGFPQASVGKHNMSTMHAGVYGN